MKTNRRWLLTLIFLPLCGCSTVAFYPNGSKAVQTWSDSTKFAFNGGGINLTADRISNSVPTRAALLGANKIVGTVASAAVAAMIPGSGVTAVVSKTAVSAVPHVVNSPSSTPAADAASMWPVKP